jgi:hypothetical protein
MKTTCNRSPAPYVQGSKRNGAKKNKKGDTPLLSRMLSPPSRTYTRHNFASCEWCNKTPLWIFDETLDLFIYLAMDGYCLMSRIHLYRKIEK